MIFGDNSGTNVYWLSKTSKIYDWLQGKCLVFHPGGGDGVMQFHEVPTKLSLGGTSFEELQCRASCPFCKETGLRIVYLSQRVAFVLTKTILFRLRFYFLFPNEIAFS